MYLNVCVGRCGIIVVCCVWLFPCYIFVLFFVAFDLVSLSVSCVNAPEDVDECDSD